MVRKFGIIVTTLVCLLLLSGCSCRHSWIDATCTSPQRCSSCGTTSGVALGHRWKNATFSKPKTCESCGITIGNPLASTPVFINEMQPVDKYGKIWSRSKDSIYSRYHTKKDQSFCWGDMNTPGQTIDVVKDNMGNVYSYGLHLDGENSSDYYVSYELQGAYTRFSGTCAFPGIVISETYARRYSKYFVVYGDDELLYVSPTMSYDTEPEPFEIDVTDVDILTILYPATLGPNEVATLFDGCVSYSAVDDETNHMQALQDGEYYALLNSWESKYMTIELLTYNGRHEQSNNYILNPTERFLTLDISQTEVRLERAWGEDVSKIKHKSIDSALNTKIWGGGTTVRENCTMEICFTVEDSIVKKIVILYAA